jgi:hypothetical protein
MVDPSTYDGRVLLAMRSAGRLARSNAEAAVDRMLREPAAVQPIDPQTAVSVLAALRRGALAALALHAALEHGHRRAFPWLTSVATGVPHLLRNCASSVREGVPPQMPSFVLRRPTDVTAGERVAFDEAEMLTDSAATVGTVLAGHGAHDRAAGEHKQ